MNKCDQEKQQHPSLVPRKRPRVWGLRRNSYISSRGGKVGVLNRGVTSSSALKDPLCLSAELSPPHYQWDLGPQRQRSKAGFVFACCPVLTCVLLSLMEGNNAASATVGVHPPKKNKPKPNNLQALPAFDKWKVQNGGSAI